MRRTALCKHRLATFSRLAIGQISLRAIGRAYSPPKWHRSASVNRKNAKGFLPVHPFCNERSASYWILRNDVVAQILHIYANPKRFGANRRQSDCNRRVCRVAEELSRVLCA